LEAIITNMQPAIEDDGKDVKEFVNISLVAAISMKEYESIMKYKQPGWRIKLVLPEEVA